MAERCSSGMLPWISVHFDDFDEIQIEFDIPAWLAVVPRQTWVVRWTRDDEMRTVVSMQGSAAKLSDAVPESTTSS